jgi:hypothetical protein
VVAVYSVADQRLKQAVPFPGGRHVGCYDGTVLLASSNQVIVTVGLVWLVPFPGGRHVGCYDGTVLLASSNQVIVTLGGFGLARFRFREAATWVATTELFSYLPPIRL